MSIASNTEVPPQILKISVCLNIIFMLFNGPEEVIHTDYYNSNLIWRTVSFRVDEVISSDHPRCEASRVIQWNGLIQEM